jgi:hypothetical protein
VRQDHRAAGGDLALHLVEAGQLRHGGPTAFQQARGGGGVAGPVAVKAGLGVEGGAGEVDRAVAAAVKLQHHADRGRAAHIAGDPGLVFHVPLRPLGHGQHPAPGPADGGSVRVTVLVAAVMGDAEAAQLAFARRPYLKTGRLFTAPERERVDFQHDRTGRPALPAAPPPRRCGAARRRSPPEQSTA